ncbi:PAM68 family protein [Gloeocapsa sp. PCC 73106]|uniref:PAM68 family protein n=1 Tax=Gloeocapsa sp. PCC 73106 TaxID=102232 RepID=UPI0002ABCE56|nr:PAM68 family protein [Gloeocapsa sp. PCC 73106]ELR96440.1 Protein of unknown function (DUF3464) [Gloeocapsa sp. PCC 73106]
MSSERKKIPFEPRQKKKKTPPAEYPENSAYNSQNASLSTIPEAVSKRMIKRMIALSGIPTALGVSSFFAFYWIVSHQWFKVPTPAVVLVTMGFFGLGVLGLSYGILSASWDEEIKGSFLGLKEFQINFKRMISAWKSAREESPRNYE